MMISIFVLILLLGLGTIGVGTIVTAIATRKLWLIPAVGAAVLFGLMGLGLIASIFFVRSSQSMQAATIERLPQLSGVASSVKFPAETIVTSPPNFAAASDVGINFTWLMIFCVVLGIVLFRSLFGRHHCHGVARVWPVLVVLGFLALWSLVRVNYSHERARRNIQAAQEAGQVAAVHKQLVRQENEQQVAKNMIEAGDQHHMLHHHSGAKIASQKVAIVATDDIHELMDQFDQPQIPVSAEVPTPPSPPAPAAAPPAPAASVPPTVAKADTKKPSTAASQNRKQPKSPKSDSAKPAAQAAAAAKSGQKEAAEKETRQVVEDVLVGPINSATRPVWVDQPPKRVGGGVQREVIVTDLWSTEVECERSRDMLLMVKVFEHMQRMGLAPELDLESVMDLRVHTGLHSDPTVGVTRSPQYDRVRSYLSSLGVTLEYARRETAKDEYLEKVDHLSVGPMLKLYTLVEFSPAVDRELRQRWEARERTEGFKFVSLGAGSLLTLLGCVFGLLKIDTWTKGYYTKRLFIGVPAAIIGGGLILGLIIGR